MRERKRYDSLDLFRILAAVLVVAIHTSPLTSYSADADFFMTRVLGRIAVPFFFMVTGQFVVSGFSKNGGARLMRYVKKIALLYGAAVLIYLPIGFYAGQYKGLGAAGVLRLLVFDGTFYHLWYFPACIAGVLLVYGMSRIFSEKQMFFAALILYVTGLAGDSYYGLIQQVPGVSDFYDFLFQIFSYTRNGIFMTPVFLLLGVWTVKSQKADLCILGIGFAVSFLAMTEEAFLLHRFDLQRHDSMYLFLLPVMFFLYKILLYLADMENGKKGNRTWFRYLGNVSTWIYILHPAVILAVRAGAKVTKLKIFVDNSLVHYLAVLAGSAAAAIVFAAVMDRCKVKKRRGRQKKRAAVLKAAEKYDGAQQEQETFCCGRAWLEIDHKALWKNVNALRAILPGDCRLMPAVKADAYGHGAALMAEELQKMGIDSFCVACVQEGVELRKKGITGEILVLGYTHPQEFPLLCRYRLTQTVIDYFYAVQLNDFGETVHVHIGIDTGMHRLGIRSGNLNQIFAIYQMQNLIVDGLFTHLCTSDTETLRHREYTNAQAAAFYRVVQKIQENGLPCPKVHMQASYGVLNYPELAGDYARIGIALYGVLSTKQDMEKWKGKLQPVLSLKARVASVKNLYQGESAGYGIQFTAGEDMKIATLAIGYADGLPRALSCGVGSVLINGQKAPVIGRICMDQMTVDISGIQHVQAGDTAVLIGNSGDLNISAGDLAQQAGTITNEILSRMGARLQRVLV